MKAAIQGRTRCAKLLLFAGLSSVNQNKTDLKRNRVRIQTKSRGSIDSIEFPHYARPGNAAKTTKTSPLDVIFHFKIHKNASAAEALPPVPIQCSKELTDFAGLMEGGK